MATSETSAKPRKQAAPTRKPRTTAKRATRTSAPRATTTSTAATRGARAQQLAERAVLIPVGAVLEARDQVGDLVAAYRTRDALERQLARFERRGGKARTQLEREVRRTRRGLERRRAHVRRSVDANVEALSGRVENVVQNGVNAGIKLVSGAQDRIARVA